MFKVLKSRYFLAGSAVVVGFSAGLAYRTMSTPYPTAAKEHLRRALVGERLKSNPEAISYEYKQAIGSCLRGK